MRGPALRLVFLGLSLSSSWGNGHATTYRALIAALARRGHSILFLERNQAWYAANRDLPRPDFCDLALYDSIEELGRYRGAIAAADAVILGSYVPDGIAVGRFVQQHVRGIAAFYDIDTPVTLAALGNGSCAYLSADLVPRFDLYLSFTGGPTIELLQTRYGAQIAAALYCSADPRIYRPTPARKLYDLGYLGTFSADRQAALERLLLEPARRAPDRRFIVAGSLYPRDLAWPSNVRRIEHLPPGEHAAFYNACRFALNVTREDMIRAGFSPSVRLFEAAACATPIISDRWPGLEEIFEPGREILVPDSTEDVLALLAGTSDRQAQAVGRAARRRLLAEHSSDRRAAEFEARLREAQAARQRSTAISHRKIPNQQAVRAFG